MIVLSLVILCTILSLNYLINSQYFIMLKCIVILTLFLLARTCHYSCSTCTNQFYSSCTTCNNQKPLLKLQAKQYSSYGVCADLSTGVANVLGVLLLLSILFACSAFPNEEIIHFAMLIQSLSLLYLVEVLWSSHTHYVLSGFTYLMILSRIQYAFSRSHEQIRLFKSQLFFKNTSLIEKSYLVIAVNGLIVLLMVAIPVFKAIRRKINKERPMCLKDVHLDRVITVLNFIYLALIQETLLAFYFGLSNGQVTPADVIVIVLYFLSLLFFTINQWFYQVIFFRTKATELNIILAKIFTPIFIVGQKNTHYSLLIMLIVFYGVDLVLTHKNRNNNSINRLLYYKIYSLIVFALLMGNYFVEFNNNNQQMSRTVSVISTLLLCGVIYFFIMELVIQTKDAFCLKQSEGENIVEMTMQEINNERKPTIHVDFNSLTAEQEVSFNDSSLYPQKEGTQSTIGKQLSQTVINPPKGPQESPKYSCSKLTQKAQQIGHATITIKPSVNNQTEPQLVADHFIASDLGQIQSKIVPKRKGKKRKNKQ